MSHDPRTPAGRAALRALEVPDCRGNPCLFGNRGGQRTQGGCHCLPRGGTKPAVQVYLHHVVEAFPVLLALVEEQAKEQAETERDQTRANRDEWRSRYGEDVASLRAQVAELGAVVRAARDYVYSEPDADNGEWDRIIDACDAALAGKP